MRHKSHSSRGRSDVGRDLVYGPTSRLLLGVLVSRRWGRNTCPKCSSSLLLYSKKPALREPSNVLGESSACWPEIARAGNVLIRHSSWQAIEPRILLFVHLSILMFVMSHSNHAFGFRDIGCFSFCRSWPTLTSRLEWKQQGCFAPSPWTCLEC